MTNQEIINKAINIIENQLTFGTSLNTISSVKDLAQLYLGGSLDEKFAVVYMTTQNEFIEFSIMFSGTVAESKVYVRPIIRKALETNAAAVILAHNHPSGRTQPSTSDIHITRHIAEGLEYVDVKVLDHIIVGKDTYSFAENGLL